MDKWLIMEESVLATVEFLGLVGYEVLTAYAMKAFWPMNQKKKIENYQQIAMGTGVASVGVDDNVP